MIPAVPKIKMDKIIVAIRYYPLSKEVIAWTLSLPGFGFLIRK